MYPGSTVLPTMSTGASDKAQLRNKGIQCYGIGPYSSEDDFANHACTATSSELPEARFTICRIHLERGYRSRGEQEITQRN